MSSTIEATEAGRRGGQRRLTLTRQENRDMNCVNLRIRFGRRYRIEYDDSYYAQYGLCRGRTPWLKIIPCQRGHIFPWGGNMLGRVNLRPRLHRPEAGKTPLILPRSTRTADDGMTEPDSPRRGSPRSPP